MPVVKPGLNASASNLAAPSNDDQQLKIMQANVMNAPVRLDALKRYMELNREQWHIIALQDVPPHLPWCRFQHHYVVYQNTGKSELTDHNNPYVIAREKDKAPRLHRDIERRKKQKVVPLYRVAFLVSRSIPESDWQVDWHEDDPNRTLLATLNLATAVGPIAIHNAYNAFDSAGKLTLDTDALLRKCTVRGNDLLLGDLNYHHELWGGPGVQPNNPGATALYKGLQAADMQCLLDPKKIEFTYSRGADTSKHTSTIDIAFAGPRLYPRFKSYQMVTGALGSESDHRALETTINVRPNKHTDIRHRWMDLPPEEWRVVVGPKLMALKSFSLETQVDIDVYFARAVQIMSKCRDRIVPITKPLSINIKVKPEDPAVQSVAEKLNNMDKLSNNLSKSSTYARLVSRHRFLQRKTKTQTYRLYVAEGSAEVGSGVYKMAKLGTRLSMPREVPHIPNLEERTPQGIRKYKTNEAKAEYIVKTIWPYYSCGKRPAPVLECPPLDSEVHNNYEAVQNLKPGELASTLSAMPSHKAAGADGIPIDALKMLLPSEDSPEDIFTSVFERPMQACLTLSHHPDQFKEAVTVMLRKPGKPSSSPKGYRPIALLSALGKFVEKLFATRLTDFLFSSGRLPAEQFGVRGRNTTQALEFIVNAAYKNWSVSKGAGSAGLAVSLMALDITGAYDRIRRDHLLRVLAQYGVPGWLIKSVWSFLSKRSTTLRLPGHRSKRFWINIGIPQGSPLSPILFVLFSMPILQQLKDSKSTSNMLLCQLRDLVITAYVDDITVLVASESHKENNKALKMLYTLLVGFASPNGTSFGADKTQIIHLCKSRSAKPFLAMPDIEGLPDEAETVIKILGILFDYRLTWADHIAHVLSPPIIGRLPVANPTLLSQILAKVRTKMWHLLRVSGSTWGPPLIALRRLYLTCVRPLFSYACALWFVVTTAEARCRWSMNLSLFKQLETEQTQCLKQISGAFYRTSGDVLCKELFVEKIAVYLARRARIYRAKNLGTPEGQRLRASWRRLRQGLSAEAMATHPFKVAYDEAEVQVRGPALRKLELVIQAGGPLDSVQREKRTDALIKSVALAISDGRMTDIWEHFLQNRASLHLLFNQNPPVLFGGWGKHNLARYKGLPKAQSTILLHCRTGIDGLNASLHYVKRSNTYKCPCGDPGAVHNAEHLFMHCERLKAARKHLAKAVPDFTFYKLVTQHPKLASAFAIRYFGTNQFKWTAKHMPNPSFGNLDEE